MASASTSKQYQLAIKIAGAVNSSFNSAIGEAGQKISNLGTIAQKAAAVAAAAWGALKLGEFIADAMQIGSEYESAFAKVQTIMDKTAISTEDMSTAIQNLSSETGIAAAELSDSVYNAISATGDTANAVALVGDATKLATAGFAESEDALSVLTTVMNAYGMSADEASKISDSLIMTQNRGVTTVGDLAGSMGKAIATASAYNVDLNNLEASYISLTKAGISTHESTTYLSSMLKELGKSGTAVSKVIEAQTGKSFGQLMQDGASLADVMEILINSVNGDSEALINLWSSAEAGKAANAIASQGIEYFRESLDALANSTGTTEAAYETMAQTFEHQSQLMKTNWDNLKISIFESISTPLARAMSAVNTYMPAIQAAASSVAEKLGSTVAAGLEYAIPKIEGLVQKAAAIFEKIRPTLERIGTAAKGAFEFLATTAVTAFNKIGEVVSKHKGIFEKLGQVARNLGGIISDIWERLKPVLTTTAESSLPKIADAVLTIVEKLADLAVKISENKALVIALVSAFAAFKGVTAISNIGNTIAAASKELDKFQSVHKSLSLAAAAAQGKFTGLGNAVGVLTGKFKLSEVATEAAKAKLGTFTDGFKAIGGVAKNAFTGLKGGITSIGSTLAGLGSKIMAFVAANPAVLIIAAIAAVIAIVVVLYNKCEWFREKVDAIIEAVKGYLSAFWEKAKEVFQKVWEVIKQVWGQIQPYLEAAWNAIIAAVSAVVDFFQTNVLPAVKAIWESIKGAFAAAWEFIKAVWEKAQPFFQAIWEAIKAVWAVVAPILKGFFEVAWAYIQAVWSVAVEWFKLIWEGIKAVFSVVVTVLGGFFTTAWEAIKAVWNVVAGYFQAVFDTIAGIFSAVTAVLHGDFSGAWEAIKGVVGTWAAWFGTVWESIKAVFSAVVSWFGDIFSSAWEAIKAVFAGVGEFFQGVWDTIVSLFTSIGTAVGDAISGAVKGAVNAVLRGAIGIINGFINAINFAIGIINAIPGVSINKLNTLEVPQLAKGGIVTAPTLLEAGEAGNEAIIPLGELWGRMQDIVSQSMSGATDGIAALADKFEAANIGEKTDPISDLLNALDGLGGDDEPDDGGGEPPVQIYYSPTNHYHFEGDAPSKEEIAGAESMSQDEFERRIELYMKNRQRKNFRG